MWYWLITLLSFAGLPTRDLPDNIQDPPEFVMTLKEKINLSVKSPAVNYYYRIESQGIELYANPNDWKYGKPESMIYFDESDLYNKIYYSLTINKVIDLYTQKGEQKFNPEKFGGLIIEPKPFTLNNTSKPLTGLRIALDPGHFAGNFEEAKDEMRLARVKMPDNTVLQVYEAQLTYATAMFLRDTLEKLGATVLVTRKKHGWTAFDKPYYQWLKEDLTDAVIGDLREGYISQETAKKILVSNDRQYIYKVFFQRYELHQRAEKINNFRPHFTLIIHYNADSQNRGWDAQGNQFTTKSNCNMTFVPGAYIAGEMQYKEQRLNFARILLSDQIERSMELAYFVSTRLNQRLNVPAYQPNGTQLYMQKVSNFTGFEGVYARNLALTRMINGPICYGETLYQDNEDEIRRLADTTIEIDGIKTSERVKEVAMGYFDGIIAYVNYKKTL
jgi:N-acetylmuramoyl-L-alanine amidase